MHLPAHSASARPCASHAAIGAPAPLQVLLLHACPILRAGLRAILAGHAEFVVGTAEYCPAHFAAPAILIADYATGLQAARHPWAQQSGHAPQVLVLTNHAKEWEVRQAIDSGISGYLLQGCSSEELVRCVQLLARGISYLSATATRSVLDSLGRAVLTRREIDVLRVLAKGGSDKHIARELGIGPGTVKSHVKHLLCKLGATARTQAVVVAIERGLLSDAPAGDGLSWRELTGPLAGATPAATRGAGMAAPPPDAAALLLRHGSSMPSLFA